MLICTKVQIHSTFALVQEDLQNQSKSKEHTHEQNEDWELCSLSVRIRSMLNETASQ